MFKQKSSVSDVMQGVKTLYLDLKEVKEREFGSAYTTAGRIAQADEEYRGNQASKGVSNAVPIRLEDGSLTDLKALVIKTTQKKQSTHTIVVQDLSGNYVAFPGTIIDPSKSGKIYANVTDASNSVALGSTIEAEYYNPGNCPQGRLCETTSLFGTLALTADWSKLLARQVERTVEASKSYYVTCDEISSKESASNLTGAGVLAQVAVESDGAYVRKAMSPEITIYKKDGIDSGLKLAVKSSTVKSAGITSIRNNFSVFDKSGNLIMAFTQFVKDTSKPSTTYAGVYSADAAYECQLNKTILAKYYPEELRRVAGYEFGIPVPLLKENCPPNIINFPGQSLYISDVQTEELSSAVGLVGTGVEAQIKVNTLGLSVSKSASAEIPSYKDGGNKSGVEVSLSGSSFNNTSTKKAEQQRVVLTGGSGESFVSYSIGFHNNAPGNALISTVSNSINKNNLAKLIRTEYLQGGGLSVENSVTKITADFGDCGDGSTVITCIF